MNTVRIRLAGWRLGVLVLGVATVAAALLVLWAPPRAVISAENWTAPQDISHTTYGSYNPEMVLDSQGYTHAVWWGDGETNSDWAIWYANNRTGTWSTPKRITPQGDFRNPKIAITPTDGLHVIYENQNGSDGEIMYVYSTDYGATWSSPQNISSSSGKAYEPGICADEEGNVHAVWIDSRWLGSPLYQATYAKRTAGTWSSPVRVQSTNIRFNKQPRVATTGTGADLRVHVTYYGKSADTDPNSLYETYYVRGTGTSFETPIKISEIPDQPSYDPDIATAGTSSVFIVWDDQASSSWHDVYLKYSTDNGTSWSTARPIVVNSTLSRFPSCAYAQSRVQIAYDDNMAGNGDAFYTYFEPSSGIIGPLINLSTSSGESKETDVVANATRIAVAWMDKGNTWNVLYSTTPPTPPGPVTPVPTATVVTPVPTNTPTPTATPDPRPQGWINIVANDPPYSQGYTRILTASLDLYAVSNVGGTIVDMLICNHGECSGAPWVPYAQTIVNWPLLNTPYACEYKYVHAQYRDNAGRTSIIYTDVINYDNYLTASMSLNGGLPYTNRVMVAVDSVDLDAQQDSCSGLGAMRLKESTGLTYTLWISYYPKLYFFLAPVGPTTRTVEVQYRDRAYNLGVLSDSIAMDLLGPVGNPPTLNNGILSTTQLLVPLSGLEATDPSGIRHVWVANYPDGPWMVLDYCGSPPCTYTWNLGYGGPPIMAPEPHTVYVMYEDGAGYGGYPGNLSAVYTDTIYVYDISSIFLPVVFQARLSQAEEGRAGGADLILVADSPEARPGQEVLLYLAARREADTPLEGTLRMVLPEGLRVLNAQSAYGRILQVEDRQVTSRERAWSGQTAWIVVRALVEPSAALPLRVQGEMTWDQGTITAAPIWIENR